MAFRGAWRLRKRWRAATLTMTERRRGGLAALRA